MLHNKCMVISLLILMAISNFAEAVTQTYAVTFVAGQTHLGLVYVTQNNKGIQTRRASITPMGKALGSTAVLAIYNGWDADSYFEVFTMYAGDASKPLEVGSFEFDNQLKKKSNLSVFSQIPGEYHPLHAFRIDNDINLLTTGTFGTSGANNYVSYPLDGSTKKVFVNPANRSPGTAAVSPDGALVSQMTFKKMNHIGLVGKLINGKLSGSPFKWLNVNDFQGYSQSLSNPIESTGTRYLAYRNFRQPGTSNSKSKVVIQNVDATTGQPLGSPRSITNFAKAINADAEKLQSIAISPDGGLILYTAWNDECKKQLLFARRLVKASSVGTPRVVVGCAQLENYQGGVYGINLTPTPSWLMPL